MARGWLSGMVVATALAGGLSGCVGEVTEALDPRNSSRIEGVDVDSGGGGRPAPGRDSGVPLGTSDAGVTGRQDGGTVPQDGGAAPVDAGGPLGCTAGATNCPIDCRDPNTWPEEWVRFEIEVLDLVNQERAAGASCGGTPYASAPALEMDPALTEAARCHSLDMGRQNYFDHSGLDGSDPGDRIGRTGYRSRTWGENIAAGQRTPEGVVDGWMNSPGHCRNIMNDSFSEIGVGYATEDSSQYGRYWTQVFATPR